MPLNQQLYNALARVFHHVEVASEGESYVAMRQPSLYRRGRYDTPPAHAGEYYRVNCWLCGDTRKRLYINHQFGVRDDDGDDHLYLANCFNEGCIDSRDMQKHLYNKLFPFNYGRRATACDLSPFPAVSSSSVSLPAPTLPAPLIPLGDPAADQARGYLLHRGFDPDEIAERWGVNYCLVSQQPRPAFSRRLVIPVYDAKRDLDAVEMSAVLAGWQARSICPAEEGSPKYLTMSGMRTSTQLYGLPQAINSMGPLVLVEGVTDVWRLGRNAVASFGKSVSSTQVQHFIRWFNGREIVVMYDRDAASDADKAVRAIRSARGTWYNTGRVVCAALPDGRADVGECQREEVWRCVWQALG